MLGREPIDRACKIIDMKHICLLDKYKDESNVFMVMFVLFKFNLSPI